MIRNRIIRIRGTMCTVYRRINSKMADMLAWLTPEVCSTSTLNNAYRMYSIPMHKFIMADMLAWLTGTVQHSRLNKVTSTAVCTVYRSINSNWRTCWPG
jgi:hypothetical protein